MRKDTRKAASGKGGRAGSNGSGNLGGPGLTAAVRSQKTQGRILPRIVQGAGCCLMPWSPTSGLQDQEMVNFCCGPWIVVLCKGCPPNRDSVLCWRPSSGGGLWASWSPRQ